MSNFEEKSNMKTKLIVLTIAVLALGTLKSFAQTTTADVNIIIDIPENGKENNQGRSLISIIESQICTTTRTLDFTFNESVGIVEIIVSNSMGENVAAVQCNSSIEQFVRLFVPTYDDTYYIYINGNSLSAYGQYVIQGALVL